MSGTQDFKIFGGGMLPDPLCRFPMKTTPLPKILVAPLCDVVVKTGFSSIGHPV